MKFSSSTLASFLVVSAPPLTLNSLPDRWVNSPALGELERGRKEITEPKVHLTKRGREDRGSVLTRSLGATAETTSHSGWYFCTGGESRSRCQVLFHFWEILRWVRSSPSSSSGPKTEVLQAVSASPVVYPVKLLTQNRRAMHEKADVSKDCYSHRSFHPVSLVK